LTKPVTYASSRTHLLSRMENEHHTRSRAESVRRIFWLYRDRELHEHLLARRRCHTAANSPKSRRRYFDRDIPGEGRALAHMIPGSALRKH
jgi:hypothetical protein